MHAVVLRRERLTFLRGGVGATSAATIRFMDLAESCLAHDPTERPSIVAIAADLARLRDIFPILADQQPSRPHT